MSMKSLRALAAAAIVVVLAACAPIAARLGGPTDGVILPSGEICRHATDRLTLSFAGDRLTWTCDVAPSGPRGLLGTPVVVAETSLSWRLGTTRRSATAGGFEIAAVELLTAPVTAITLDSGEVCSATVADEARLVAGRRVNFVCPADLVVVGGFVADRDGLLVQVATLDAAAQPPVLRRERTRRVALVDHRPTLAPVVAPRPAPPLLGSVWALDRIVWADGRESFPATAADFTLTLFADGGVEFALDCNRGRGEFALGEGTLRFASIATTRAYCGADSIDATVMGLLDAVERYAFDDDGALLLHDALNLARMVWRVGG
jgi:heat shock protein HslJ